MEPELPDELWQLIGKYLLYHDLIRLTRTSKNQLSIQNETLTSRASEIQQQTDLRVRARLLVATMLMMTLPEGQLYWVTDNNVFNISPIQNLDTLELMAIRLLLDNINANIWGFNKKTSNFAHGFNLRLDRQQLVDLLTYLLTIKEDLTINLHRGSQKGLKTKSFFFREEDGCEVSDPTNMVLRCLLGSSTYQILRDDYYQQEIRRPLDLGLEERVMTWLPAGY